MEEPFSKRVPVHGLSSNTMAVIASGCVLNQAAAAIEGWAEHSGVVERCAGTTIPALLGLPVNWVLRRTPSEV